MPECGPLQLADPGQPIVGSAPQKLGHDELCRDRFRAQLGEVILERLAVGQLVLAGKLEVVQHH